MRYELIGSNDTKNVIRTVLQNRGIEDCDGYVALKEASRSTYEDLDYIQEAVELFDKHVSAKNPIGILADNDVDGQTSATLMYKWIKAFDPKYDVRLYVHGRNKSHGLSDRDFNVDDDVKLLIVPDAGSNDLEEHKKLYEIGVDCLCLDHHHVEINIKDSPAIIINNQSSTNYDNKNCCGASVTLEFCRALDNYYWTENCDDYLDLVAVANVCDVMTLSEFETRAIVNEGLVTITNKLLQEIIKAQAFSMKDRINPHTVGFYIGPLVNAFIRLATHEERTLLLKAFCEIEDETFEYTKRGEALPIEENIYEHVVRLAKSYKGKQDRARDKAVVSLLKKASKYENDKVAIIDATEEIEGPLTGLVAIKISESINKPTLLVRKYEGALSGSGRAFDNCPVEDFRKLVEECPYSIFAQGHAGAFGASIKQDNIDEARQWFNEQLEDIDMEKIYHVDFIFDMDDIDVGFIHTIDQNQDLWGHGLDEPLIVVENIVVKRSDIRIQGKESNSVTFTINDIKYVEFKMGKDNELLTWASEWDGDDNDEITITIVGEVSISEYKGTYTPQVMIKENKVIYKD